MKYSSVEIYRANEVFKYTKEELARQTIPEYVRLVELVDIQSAKYSVNNPHINDIEACQWFRSNFNFTPYYSQYERAFINLCYIEYAKKFAQEQQRFNNEANANIRKFLDLDIWRASLAVFIFDLMRSQGSVSLGNNIESLLRTMAGEQLTLIKEAAASLYAIFPTTATSMSNTDVAATSDVLRRITWARSFGAISVSNASWQNLDSVQTTINCEVVSAGRIKGLVNGLQSFYLDDTPLVAVQGSGSSKTLVKQLPSVKVDFKKGTATQAPSLIGGCPSLTTHVNKEVKYGEPIVQRVYFENADDIAIYLSTNGCYNENEAGLLPYNISYRATNKNTGRLGDYKSFGDSNLVMFARGFKQWCATSFRLGDSETYPVDIRVMRTKPEYPDTQNKSVADSLKVDRITGIINMVQSWPGLAHLVTSYRSDIFNKEPTRKVEVYGREIQVPSNYNPDTRRYSGTWDGTFKSAYTNNPVWIILDLLTDKTYGAGNKISINDIDTASFYSAARYCDDMIDGEPRWTCNIVIDKSKKLSEWIADILNSCCMQWRVSNKISIIADRPRLWPIFTYSQRTVINGEFNYQGSNLKTRSRTFAVTFQNKEKMYEKDEIVLEANNDDVADFNSTKKEHLNGCTSVNQAIRYAKYKMAIQQQETQMVTFSTSLELGQVEQGDVIAIEDSNITNEDLSRVIRHVDPVVGKAYSRVYVDKLPDHLKTTTDSGNKKFMGDIWPAEWLDTYLYWNESTFVYNTRDKVNYPDCDYFYMWNGGQHGPLLQVGNVLVLKPTNYHPPLYKVIEKEIKPENNIVIITAQLYSPDKYTYLNDKVEEKAYIRYTESSRTLKKQKPQINDITTAFQFVNGQCYLTATVTGTEGLRFDAKLSDVNNMPLENQLNVGLGTITFNTQVRHGQTYLVNITAKTGGLFDESESRQVRVIVDLEQFRAKHPRITTFTLKDVGKDIVSCNLIWALENENNQDMLTGYDIYVSTDKALLETENLTIEPLVKIRDKYARKTTLNILNTREMLGTGTEKSNPTRKEFKLYARIIGVNTDTGVSSSLKDDNPINRNIQEVTWSYVKPINVCNLLHRFNNRVGGFQVHFPEVANGVYILTHAQVIGRRGKEFVKTNPLCNELATDNWLKCKAGTNIITFDYSVDIVQYINRGEMFYTYCEYSAPEGLSDQNGHEIDMKVLLGKVGGTPYAVQQGNSLYVTYQYSGEDNTTEWASASQRPALESVWINFDGKNYRNPLGYPVYVFNELPQGDKRYILHAVNIYGQDAYYTRDITISGRGNFNLPLLLQPETINAERFKVGGDVDQNYVYYNTSSNSITILRPPTARYYPAIGSKGLTLQQAFLGFNNTSNANTTTLRRVNSTTSLVSNIPTVRVVDGEQAPRQQVIKLRIPLSLTFNGNCDLAFKCKPQRLNLDISNTLCDVIIKVDGGGFVQSRLLDFNADPSSANEFVYNFYGVEVNQRNYIDITVILTNSVTTGSSSNATLQTGLEVYGAQVSYRTSSTTEKGTVEVGSSGVATVTLSNSYVNLFNPSANCNQLNTMAFIQYDDTSRTNQIKVYVTDAYGKPTSATVNWSINGV